MTNLGSVLKSRDITLPTEVCRVKAIVFPVVMYGCETWTIKKAECQMNRCLWIVVLEKTRESPLESKGIKPVNLKGDQPEYSLEGTDAEAESPVFWSSDANRWLIGKVPDAGKDWGQKEKTASEDEMAGQHHLHNEHELGQTLGNGEGCGGLVCGSPWGCSRAPLGDWTTLHFYKHFFCTIPAPTSSRTPVTFIFCQFKLFHNS